MPRSRDLYVEEGARDVGIGPSSSSRAIASIDVSTRDHFPDSAARQRGAARLPCIAVAAEPREHRGHARLQACRFIASRICTKMSRALPPTRASRSGVPRC